ncbi:hypothetical protein HY634_01850 [Candidatus Uhrbacteria bacterium]|nr:hypothetical protein [Candidatus Uhrbacteria bacterium]
MRRDDPYPRNVIVEIWFNEAVNPIAVAGAAPEFQNLRVESSVDPRRVPGEFRVTNQYRTVEFTPSESCGVNSCGVNTYCLPANAALTVAALAANLTPAGDDGAQAVLPFDGVVDMAGNSLDGDRDTLAEGPPVDSYSSAFATSGDIDRTAPALEASTPNAEEGSVALDAPITATFTKIMRTGTLISLNMSFAPQPDYEAWYAIRSEHLDRDGEVASSTPPVKTRSVWMHGVLRPTTPGVQYYYFPGITSGAQDQFQNCFYPGIGPGIGGAGQCVATPDQPYCCNGEPSANRCPEPYLPAP